MNQQSKDLITVGITAYNEGSYLQEAWNSVVNQTDNRWEAIMVLDGGADRKTKKIFEKIEHPKLKKFIFKENKGPFGTRTKAIELTNSEWYCGLDADDLYPPNTINDVLKTIRKNPRAEFVYGDCEIFSEKEHMIEQPVFDNEILCVRPIYNPISPITKSLFNYIGGYADGMYINADWDFWLNVHEKKKRGAYTNSIIYRCRRRKNNVGHKFMHLRPVIVEEIISKHPHYFYSDERRNKARYNVLEKLARYNRSLGKRNQAADYVRKATQYGDSMPVFDSILKEEEMSTIRYFFRRLGRLI